MSGIEPGLLATGGVIFCISIIGTLLALGLLALAVVDSAVDRREERRLPRATISPRSAAASVLRPDPST